MTENPDSIQVPSPGSEDPDSKTPAGSPSGDRIDLSGDFRGAVINIKSTIVSSDVAKDLENLPPEPGESPFQGLQYFDEKDADRFFGRETLVAKITGRLADTRFLVIIGASGSGKSSVMRAGVIPALRHGERLADGSMPPTNSGQWDIRLLTPTAHPLDALAASLTHESDSIKATTDMRDELACDPQTLPTAARRLLSQNGRQHLLLVIDQFEEIFTQCRQAEERQTFIDNLLHAVDPADSQPITLLISLRADYYAQVSLHDRLRELVSQNQEYIGAMSKDELTRAILQPAALGNWKVQEGLVEVLLDDLGHEPGALPLLSHALLESWMRRRGRVMTLSGYVASGGVHGAIAQTAETVFRQRLSPEQQPIARMIFIKLAEMGEGSLDTRRRAAFSELITRSTDAATIDAVLAILTDARLVTIDTVEPGDTRVVEVSHEVLIREWSTLRDWLNENREGLILHRQLTEDVNDWLKLDRDPGALYRGTRLKQTLDWARQNRDLISLSEQEFLDASQKISREEQKQVRSLARARWVQISLGGLALLLVAGIVMILLAANGFFTPQKMNGIFNIAVAQFGEMSADGQIRPSNVGKQISGWAANYLREQVNEDPNIQIWPNEGNLINRTKVPFVTPENVETVAQGINASLLLYGYMDTNESPPQLVLKFWIAPQAKYKFEEIQGNFSLGEPIRVADLKNPGISVQSELDRQASALAWIGMGLAQEQLGQSEAALASFKQAVEFAPQSEILQFFLGREYLFISDQTLINRGENLQAAEDAFLKSISLNDRYARAYIGLGSVYSELGLYLEAVQQDQQTAGQMYQKSIGAFQTAIGLNPDAREYGNPVQDVARLGLVKAYFLKGVNLYNQRDKSSESYFNLSLQILDKVRPVFEESVRSHESHRRYLAQTYEYLGLAYQMQGYIREDNGDYEHAKESYLKSMQYLQKCIDQGNGTPDLIIQNDIVNQYCGPNYKEVKSSYEKLSGDQ
jgi:tetratricopeptide (TPR) repeat protein